MSTSVTATAPLAGEWLASTDADRTHALRWWASTGYALMRVGRGWDAVLMAPAAYRLKVPKALAAPTIYFPRHDCAAILVPPGTSEDWDAERTGATCLGVGAHLLVPTPASLTPPNPHWLRTPGTAAFLADPGVLHSTLAKLGRPV